MLVEEFPALPVKATAEAGENREVTDMTRRFWVGLALVLPGFVLEMGGHISSEDARFRPAANFRLESVRPGAA
jgi:hypothetical protein